MRVIDISAFEDGLVLHFQTDDQRMNAYTLASVLVSIADAAKAANAAINPGYDIEIVVEALGPGSFRARIRAVYQKTRSLFADSNVKALVIGLLASFIYERTLSRDNSVRVKVGSEEVIVERGDDRIIVPRRVYEATREAEKNPAFRKSIAKAMEAISEDSRVQGFGFVRELDSPPPDVLLDRELMQQLAVVPDDDPETRTITEQGSLIIVKAILERSRRKWEFVWHGIRISAPISDDVFYNNFCEHAITIAPGDELQVRMNIRQSRDPKTGIYTNTSYDVVEVLAHKVGMRQGNLGYSAGS